uniref:Palmitoyltransferase n=1 Tax=Electrophorus electricus TaxID=8005 RepID=A0A4W4HSD2_ELEEL
MKKIMTWPPSSPDLNLIENFSHSCKLCCVTCRFGALERCKELVEAGYDVRQPDKENVTLLHWAAINNRVDLVKYYIAKGAVVDQLGGDLNSTPLHWAIRQGHLQMVIQLMRYGADPSLADGEGYRSLHLAVLFQHMPIAAYLMAKGQEVDVPDINGQTSLMLAAQKIIGPEPTNFLLKCNASVNAVDKVNQNSPLHYAVLAGNVDAVHLLLEAGASVDLQNTNVSALLLETATSGLPWLFNVCVLWAVGAIFDMKTESWLLKGLLLACVIAVINLTCSAVVQVLFTLNVTALLYYYLRTCRTDPGVIKVTEEEKKKNIVVLAEAGCLDPRIFCTSCMMRKPMRAHHCFSCNACITKQDHHSVWINGCIGARNHQFFILFLVLLTLLGCWMFYGSLMYWSKHCIGHYADDGMWGAVTGFVGCSPWVLYIFCMAFFHTTWVSILLAQQMYQIAFLGLTTAERTSLMHGQKKLPNSFSLRQNPFK